jgi:hypothetical protein
VDCCGRVLELASFGLSPLGCAPVSRKELDLPAPGREEADCRRLGCRLLAGLLEGVSWVARDPPAVVSSGHRGTLDSYRAVP